MTWPLEDYEREWIPQVYAQMECPKCNCRGFWVRDIVENARKRTDIDLKCTDCGYVAPPETWYEVWPQQYVEDIASNSTDDCWKTRT